MKKEVFFAPELQVHRMTNRHDGPKEYFVVHHYGSSRMYADKIKLLEDHPDEKLRCWVDGCLYKAEDNVDVDDPLN